MRSSLFLILILILGYSAQGQTKNFLDQAYLETNATADTLVVPDRIYLSIVISEADTKDRKSLEEMENKLQERLKSLGIDTEEQLMLADLESNFKDYFLKKTGVLKSKAYTLLVYDALTAGRVIQALESSNIANVNFRNAEVSNLDDIKLHLRGQAVKKAMEQAKTMLAPLSQSLGKAIYISDLNTGIIYGWQNRMSSMEIAMARSDQYQPIDIDFQKVKISSSVNVKFAIQ